ncbi:MAG: LPXTG cell wall anchor domain-containing protein [Streptococcaceae bacterium]|jgi:LPXTG-motif cell wall-anchored protein|nr:LPXTG cell wall anchor domain-containing protein [Streptococcaceae bacterium]
MTQETHFRSWKSGKFWLYGAALLATLSVGGVATGIVPISTFDFSITAQGATSSPTVTIEVPVNAIPAGNTPYIWSWGDANLNNVYTPLTLNAAGTAYQLTFTPSSISGLGFLVGYSVHDDAGLTSWDNDFVKLDPNNQINGGLDSGSSYVFYVDAKGNYTTLVAPTVTAPTSLPKGTVGENYDLATTPATVSDPNNMGTGTISSYSVADPLGTAVSVSGTSFTPETPGRYTVTYTYAYTTPAGTTLYASDQTTLQVASQHPNTINLPKAPDITQGKATDLSPATIGVTTSPDTTAALDIQSVLWTPAGSTTAQELAANDDGTYTFPTSGTYAITYEDATGATATLTGNVVAQPASFTPTPGASTTAVAGNPFDTASLVSLTDPNNSAITIANAVITVLGPSSSAYFSTAQELQATTLFTPDVTGTYRLTYSYVDGTGKTQTYSTTLTVVPQPEMSVTDSFQSTLTVNANSAGSYNYDPATQGVSVKDPADSKAQPVVVVQDSAGTALIPSANGTYTLSAGNIYYTQWSYPNAAPYIEQTIIVLANGQSLPTLDIPVSTTTALETFVNLINLASLTDGNGKSVDAASALADGTLTISMQDASGNTVDTSNPTSWLASALGSYTLTYTYTDATTGLTLSNTLQLVVTPKTLTLTLPEDITTQLTGKETYLFNPQTASVTDSSSATDNGYFAPIQLLDASGTLISPDDSGDYNLSAGVYSVLYSYNYYDAAGNAMPALEGVQKITVLAAPVLSAGHNQTLYLKAGQSTVVYSPDVTASDGSEVTVTVTTEKGKATQLSNGSYLLTAGSYQFSYTDANTSNSPVSEVITVKQESAQETPSTPSSKQPASTSSEKTLPKTGDDKTSVEALAGMALLAGSVTLVALRKKR